MKPKPQLPYIDIQEAISGETMNDIVQGYKQALDDFSEAEGDKLPDELEQFLLHVAKTGDTVSTWDKVQKVFIQKMKLVLDEFYEAHPYQAEKVNENCENDPYDEMKTRLIELAKKFDSPPFTMQRLCELVTTPNKNYTKCEKYMRALEKNLMVVTSWYYPSRRSSDTNEQMNGGFEARPNLSATERPWAALPPSPIATSAPTLPSLAQPADSIASSTEPLINSSNPDDANIADTDDKDSVAVASSTTEVAVEAQESVEHVTADVESDSVMRDGAGDETADTSSVGDAASIALTNSEKDALKEPLPGVGTLVEKHSARSASFESSQEVQAPLEKVESPRPIQASKRKCDDDAPTEAGSAVKRRKSNDDSIETASLDESVL